MKAQCNNPKCGCHGFNTGATFAIDLTAIYSGMIVYISPTNSGKYAARGDVCGKMTDEIGLASYPLDALQKFLELFNMARDRNISAWHDRM